MASFARSFKSPSYLSPRLRPAIPGRSLSASSDVSINSNASGRSDDVVGISDWVPSAPNTPGIPIPDDRPQTNHARDVSASSSFQSNSSKPIAIELPSISRSKISSAPVYTPPEPLSARGDLPGGYFPLHEDPSGRVHHPHPFHHDSKLARHKSITLAAETSPLDGRKPPATTSAANPSVRATANMPVASYIPSGFHDTPLPMGKYYPSNYEQRNRDPRSPRASFSESVASNRSSPQLPQSATPSLDKPPEDEVRRRMVQYQRDMVAQARLALTSSASSSSKSSLSLQGLPIKELRYLTTSPHKPMSPKLMPLGSPGPVTPMELESSSYLDKGQRMGDTLAPPGMGFVAHASR